MKHQKIIGVVAFRALELSALSILSPSPATAAVTVLHVLPVRSWNGVKGAFSTIQSAADAASPGDWILIAPFERFSLAANAACYI